ncbi:hypothetical protein AFV7_gp48 [Betalipothrixvirus pezzuloense]|uniref:Uncharacterized protein n=1 Tax=Betalipothrixvirus pezzuloense TaxID=346883 RepID=A7WKR5_9VIRU|nr:hypothetical protein AFV7_gp48 [Acidianus filamentous virus 7]CAJ31668.1 conserved hypothetical protein [Acidianus filamentous virus 7]
MTLSVEYLSAVSTMIVYGQNQKTSVYNYYYYSSSVFQTYPPDGIVAVLKNNGATVATLTGYQISVSTGSAQFFFFDASNKSYTFDEVDIYTTKGGSLYYLISRNVNLSYSKSSQEVVVIYFTLEIEQTPSIFVNYCFLYLLVPGLIAQKVFNFTNYIGISSYMLCNVPGKVQFTGIGVGRYSLKIFLQLQVNGGGTPAIIALTNTYTGEPPLQTQIGTCRVDFHQVVLSVILFVNLPNTSATYPIEIGLEYQVSS